MRLILSELKDCQPIFAKRAEEKMDELWDEGLWEQEKNEQVLHECCRGGACPRPDSGRPQGPPLHVPIGWGAKKNIKHLSFGRKSVPLQADYYQKRISD